MKHFSRNPKFGDKVLRAYVEGARKNGSIIHVDEKNLKCTVEYLGGFKQTYTWDEMIGYVANSFGGLWIVGL